MMAYTKEQIRVRCDVFLAQHPEGTLYSSSEKLGTHHYRVDRLEDRV